MMIKQLAHVCTGATNLEETERFYCDILGLQKRFEFDKDGQIIGFYLALGDRSFIEVFADPESAARNQNQLLLKHLCLEVEDMDALIETVRTKGWAISDKRLGGDNSWQAWLKDPSGIDIELHQYTAESSQFSGQVCLVDW